ncbi:MAG: protein kinase [Gemmatales bacterium]
MAEQSQPVQRKVALKVIKPGMDSKQVVARFEAERQALAMMDHVNIARVIDGGTTESGRPYFVMELINGVPITKYCDDNHLTPRERLELFISVCHAIQHAHQKGIIHRDIKPSNVLVTIYEGKPVAKVIDFGVAKATEQKLTDRTLCTNFGTMVGTLEYMSPEQAEMSAMGVDTRSDIYSLGVLLYELLTGSTPLSRQQMKDAAYADLLRLLKDVDPPKPSTRLSESGKNLALISAMRKMEPAKLTKLVRGELDWIVMKPLEKDRNRRYETASAFADDIQRYLKHEPVKVCPPSATYRFRKFARRYKVAIITTGLVAMTLLISTADSLYQMFEAKKARALADERLVNETEARNLALAAVDRMLTRVGDESVRGIPQMEQVRLKLYQDAVDFYKNMMIKQPDDPLLQYSTAIATYKLGEMYMELGHPDKTRECYKESEQRLEGLLARFPDDPTYRVELARFANHLYWQAFLDKDDLERYLIRSIELVKPVVDSHPEEFEIRGERVRTTLADCLRHQFSYSSNELSWYLPRLPELSPQQKEMQLRDAIRLCEKDPGHGKSILAYCNGSLSRLEGQRGRNSKMVEYSNKQIQLHREILQQVPQSSQYRWELATSLRGHGQVMIKSGQLIEGEKAHRESITMLEQLAKDFPSGQFFLGEADATRTFLGDLYLDQKLYDKAVREYIAADNTYSVQGRVEWRKDGKGYDPTKKHARSMWWGAYRNLGIAQFHLKQYDKALAAIAEAVRQKPDDAGNITWIDTNILASCTDASFANGLLALANKQVERTNGNGASLALRGWIYAAMRSNELAKVDLEKASLTNTELVAENNYIAWLLANIPDARLRFPRQAVLLSQKTVKHEPLNGNNWNTLGVCHYRAGNWVTCLEAFEKAISLGHTHWSNYLVRAMAHWQLQQNQEANEWYEKAAPMITSQGGLDDQLLRQFRAEAKELMKSRGITIGSK